MIVEIRGSVGAQLKPIGVPVWTHKPEDINETPCFVVDRPRLVIDGQLYTVTVSVVAIGRRINDDDSQAELDALVDSAMQALPSPNVVVTAVEPVTATVAELTHLAYRIDCLVGAIDCYN